MRQTIEINGSYGQLIACAATGAVLSYDHQGQGLDENPNGAYADILAVDVAEWREEYPGEEPTHLDVLDIGFWTDAGTYVCAEQEWRDDHRSPEAWDAAQVRMFPTEGAN